MQVYAAPLAGGARAVVLLNLHHLGRRAVCKLDYDRHAEAAGCCRGGAEWHTPACPPAGGQYLLSNITVSWKQLGLPAGTPARVRDLYAEKDLGEFTGSFTAEVWAHDVVAVRIDPVGGLSRDTWRPWHQPPVLEARAAGGRKAAPGGHDQHAMFAASA